MCCADRVVMVAAELHARSGTHIHDRRSRDAMLWGQDPLPVRQLPFAKVTMGLPPAGTQ